MVERDANGRFTSEYKGGPGRPPKKREERFLEITLSTVTFKDWEDIIKKAIDQAKKGNSTARKWLSDYLLGPPVQKTEITGADGNALIIEYVNNWRDSAEDHIAEST